MSRIIRKISVGANFPDGSLHYQVGSKQMGNYLITSIVEVYDEVRGVRWDIYLSNKTETVLWKTIIGVPVVIEDDIFFE